MTKRQKQALDAIRNIGSISFTTYEVSGGLRIGSDYFSFRTLDSLRDRQLLKYSLSGFNFTITVA